MSKITAEQKSRFLAFVQEKFGAVVSRSQIMLAASECGVKEPQWLLNDKSCKVARGQFDLSRFGYSVPKAATMSVPVSAPAMMAQVIPMPAPQLLLQKKLHTEFDSAVPEKDKDYVAFGFHTDLTTIIKSNLFYPVFISGLSGNGKTTMVEQICARLGREVYRVNISTETDEDALVGGHTLVDGNVVYREGPALIAMRRGAILLLDEVDRGSNKLICLQAIMEGKPYFNKKTGEVVQPSPGFTIIATANTKGQGSDDGKFSAAQILDEAFLERFAVSYEQQYPSGAQEKKIVLNNMVRLSCVSEEFADRLIAWAEIIRKTYAEGGIDDIISTRRLVNIVQAYAMFGNRIKAIELCINRFSEEVRSSFMELYMKLEDPEKAAADAAAAALVEEKKEDTDTI